MTGWRSTGWTHGRNVSRMLEFLWVEGVLTVAGRTGKERAWELADRWFPAWTPRKRLTAKGRTDLAVEHALRALGVATPRHISSYFIRGGYSGLESSVKRLRRSGRVLEATVAGADGWLLHRDVLPLVDSPWKPRTVLLSPFDNLVADRRRTAELFGYDYAVEIYTPAAKRKRGYYAMPILAGDRLVGTVDPRLDRRSRVLRIERLTFESGYRPSRGLAAAVNSMARFVGADSVEGLRA